MDSTQRPRIARMARPHPRTPVPSTSQVLALAVGTALALSACSAAADTSESETDTETPVSSPAAMTDAAPSGAGTEAQETTDDDAGGDHTGTVIDGSDDEASDDGSAPDGASDDGSAPDDATQTEGSATPEAAPPRPESPANFPEDDLLPPGFSPVDSALREDAFDGPDLHLSSVTISDGDTHRVVFFVDGTGYPGWEVSYPATPGTDPAASPSTLQVTLTGVDAAAAIPEFPTSSALHLESARSADGDLSVLLHLDQRAEPFRVHLQHDPLRVVVEVTSAG